MAGYDIFSQMTGPAVPINLFADNATAGINAGNALPTPLTAGIQGAIKGIETGQQIVSNQQNIALKQNEIDQLPVTNAQQQEALTNSQNINKINALKLDIAETTHSLEIDAETANLENQASKLRQEKQLRDKEQEFVSTFSQSNPQQQAQMMLSGKYADLFNANPRLYQQQLNSVATNPNNGLPDAQREQLARLSKAVGAIDYWDKQAARNDEALQGAKGALLTEGWVNDAADKMGVTPEEVPEKTEFVPHGKYEQTPSGMLIPDTINGGWKLAQGYDPAAYKGQFDLIDKEAGQVIDGTGSLTDKNKQVGSTFLQKKYISDGTYKSRSVSSIMAAPKKQPTKPQAPATFADPKSAQQEAPQTFTDKVARRLNVPSAVFKSAALPMQHLEEQLKRYVEDPTARGSIEGIKTYNETIDQIARTITDEQYDKSPAIQSQFTQSHVDAYNRLVQQEISKYQLTDSTLVADAYTVQTPRDLYYQKQLPLISAKLNSVVDDILDNREQSKPDVVVAKRQEAARATANFLSGVAQGGSAGSR